MQWSPDGQFLAAGSGSGFVVLWDTDSVKPKFIQQVHTDSITSLTFIADGKALVTSSQDKTTKLLSAKTGEVISTLDSEIIQTAFVQASPTGKFLAVVTSSNRAFLWDLDQHRVHRRLDYGANAYEIDIDPFGNRLAIACDHAQVVLFDIQTPGPPVTLQLGPDYGDSPRAIHPRRSASCHRQRERHVLSSAVEGVVCETRSGTQRIAGLFESY
jgi:WD40 repeat protein